MLCLGCFHPSILSGLFYLKSLDKFISVYFLLLPCFIEISVYNAISVDPDQTPHFAASGLGVHCLPMPFL